MKSAMFLLTIIFISACGGGGSSSKKLECEIGKYICGNDEICLYERSAEKFFCTESCNPAAVSSCENGLVCEKVENEELSSCFLPVYISGTISAMGANPFKAIGGAHVIGMNSKDGKSTDIAVSNEEGVYSFNIPLLRNHEGKEVLRPLFYIQAFHRNPPLPQVR